MNNSKILNIFFMKNHNAKKINTQECINNRVNIGYAGALVHDYVLEVYVFYGIHLLTSRYSAAIARCIIQNLALEYYPEFKKQP